MSLTVTGEAYTFDSHAAYTLTCSNHKQSNEIVIQQFLTRIITLPTAYLIEAVHQTIRRVSIVTFVQYTNQQLATSDDHLTLTHVIFR